MMYRSRVRPLYYRYPQRMAYVDALAGALVYGLLALGLLGLASRVWGLA